MKCEDISQYTERGSPIWEVGPKQKMGTCLYICIFNKGPKKINPSLFQNIFQPPTLNYFTLPCQY